MSKGMAELPAVSFSGDDIMSGRFPSLQARMALEHGSIYKWVIDSGPDAGEYIFMVGPEANRFVMHTGREHFSHDLGWTPIMGDSLGKGLLNMDDPEHARHRKMWNPAFTSACINMISTIEVSSITSRSHSSGLSALRLKPPPFGSTSSSR